MKKIAVIHTSLVSYQTLKELFTAIIPEAELFNIIDESLLSEVKAKGDITPGIVSRMCRYMASAEESGADIILSQCSSVGEAAEIAARTVSTPVMRIDLPMAEEAVKLGGRIAVIATVASTVKPSVGIIEKQADICGLTDKVKVVPVLVDGALDMLMSPGGQERHNQFVLRAIEQAQEEHDVIVLAQGSMTVMLPYIGHIRVPVLTSPKLAVKRIAQILQEVKL